MSVVVSIEDVGPCEKELKVEVPVAAVEAEYQRVVEEFRRRAKLPGFRKGKVPSHLVVQRFREDIEREVVDRLVPRYWRQAQAESNLDPLLPPRVGEVELQAGAPLAFSARVEVRPNIELGSLEDFDLPELDVEPTAEEIQAATENLRAQIAEWVAVDRPAAEGDRVKVEVAEAAPEKSGAQPRTVEVEVGHPQVWEELSRAITGLGVGQEKEYSGRPKQAEEEQERNFRVKVLEVRERELPPLDDSLAARLGEFSNLEELHRHVTARLRQNKTLERRRRREQALLEQLRERHPTALPSGVVEHEIEHLLQEYAESLAHQGVDVEKAQIDWQSVAEEARPQAERRVHERLLLDAVTAARSIVLDEAEFEQRLAVIARAQRRSTVALREGLSRAGKLTQLREQMRREKGLQYLLGEDMVPETSVDETPADRP